MVSVVFREKSWRLLRDHITLMKPRVMWLSVFTAFIGMLCAPVQLGSGQALVVLGLIFLGSGAAAVFNMVYDSDIDVVMQRTRDRPIPAGRIGRDHALLFAWLLAFVSVGLLWLAANLLAAFLLAFAIFFYAVIYTRLLKRHHVQNIVIGGLAGALPPLIGWSAASEMLTPAPLLMVTIIFLWTPPHFWALCLFAGNDFARARLPMAPFVWGIKRTKQQMLGYCLAMVAASLLLPLAGVGGWLYAAWATLGGAAFIWLCFRLCMQPGDQPDLARQIFLYSIFYLFILFSLMPVPY